MALFAPQIYAGQRVLVTGATGFIGRHAARVLAACGAEVILTGRNAEPLQELAATLEKNVRVCVADLSKAGEFTQLHREAAPALTFNLAGYGIDRTENDSVLFEALNADLPEEIARAAAAGKTGTWPGLAVVHCGSGFEYGPVAGPVSEESDAKPTSLYARTKLAGAQRFLASCRRSGLPGAVARLFVVYGPGEHPARLLPSLIRAKQTGEPVPMTAGHQLRDFTFVEDVAEGLLRIALLRASPDVINVATGRLTSVREFAQVAADEIGLHSGQLQLGALPYRDDEVAQGAVSDAKITQFLGWKPRTSIREGIRRTVRQ